MNKKFAAVLIIFGIVLILGGVSVYYYRNFVLQNSEGKQSQKTEEMKVEDKKITDNTKPFKIDIIYPYIDGFDEFNQKVENIVNGRINEFKTYSLENDAAVKQTDPESYAKYPRQYDLDIGYEKGEINENIVSVVFEVYSFVGGAHGATNFIPLNYDTKTKKEIKLADLFLGQPDYIQKISDYCIADLTKQVTQRMESIEGLWIQDGAGPEENNFSIFMIKKDSIVFYFEQYQIASYALGDFKVTMPR